MPIPSGSTAALVAAISSGIGAAILTAVQLATASENEVIATASPHNAAMLLALGAVQVLDHGDADVVDRSEEALVVARAADHDQV